MEKFKIFWDNFTDGVSQVINDNDVGILYTAVARWIFVVLALYIVIRTIRSLIISRSPSEVWSYVQVDGKRSIPITHWENVVGRLKSSDIQILDNAVSRNHGTICRDSKGNWTYTDLKSKNGSYINGEKVEGKEILYPGDKITIGNAELTLLPISIEEQNNNKVLRKQDTRLLSPVPSFLALTIFQVLAFFQLWIAKGSEYNWGSAISMLGMCIVMWIYYFSLKHLQKRGFEMEILAFFLCTLSLAVTVSRNPDQTIKQFAAIIIGIILMIIACSLLRDLEFMKKIRKGLVIAAILILVFNIAFGTVTNGAANWVHIGGISIQPSELVKLVFVIVGAASMDELFEKKNLTLFMVFSFACLGALALMGDFGTALIFFATFVVMSFLRSGDFSRMFLILGIAFAGGLLLLKFKEHIAARFETWGHVWEMADTTGWQQTRSMCASASGGLIGVGGGKGWFSDITASETDLVFGLISEEWGLIIGILAILIIVTFAVFSIRSIMAGRSAFYTIAACGASTILVLQTILNVFGSLDILPFTGVTFPFLSVGGTSMIASWGLLGFLKTTDTRENASFAVALANRMTGGGN